MHRIDGPGATVDNEFTEGDPVGGIPATVVTGDWLNDVQEELMSALVAASIAPVKGTQDQLLKAIRTLSGGVVGRSLNVKMSVTVAGSSATLTADQIVVATSLSGQTYRLAGLNKTINLATTGAGGMDTGTAPVSGYVAIYAIYNPATQVSALLAVNATAAAAPEVCTGVMPSGYTASALVSVWPTNGSGQLIVGMQIDRSISIPTVQVLNTGTVQPTPVVLSIAAVVPKNARFVSGTIGLNATVSGTVSMFIYGSESTVGEQSIVNSGTGMRAPFNKVLMITPQQVRWSGTSVPAVPTFFINITGYDF